MGTWGRRWVRLAVMSAAVGVAATAGAHEPGATRVSIAIAADGRVEVRIPAIPAALAPLLDTSTHAGGPGDGGPGDEARFLARRSAWLDTVRLEADGAVVPLTFRWERGPSATAAEEVEGTIVLTGQVETGAHHLVWRYTLPVGAYPIRVTTPGAQAAFVVWAVGDRESEPIRLALPSRAALAAQYVGLGVVHIVPRGIDHILFVLGLFLLQRSWRPLLLQVSAFTAAHTLTLGASVAGLVTMPAAVVEPLIGASVAWVAVENVWRSSVSRSRVGVVFLCGLLHGLGFAGVLAELGLPAGARAIALVSFNLGVELGQVSVLACAFLATWWVAGHPRRYRHWVVVPVSCVIAVVGIYWTLERLGAVV